MLGRRGKNRKKFGKEKEAAGCVTHLQQELLSSMLFHASPNFYTVGYPSKISTFWAFHPLAMWKKKNRECSGSASTREGFLGCRKAPAVSRKHFWIFCPGCFWTRGFFLVICWFHLCSPPVSAVHNSSQNGLRYMCLNFSNCVKRKPLQLSHLVWDVLEFSSCDWRKELGVIVFPCLSSSCEDVSN